MIDMSTAIMCCVLSLIGGIGIGITHTAEGVEI